MKSFVVAVGCVFASMSLLGQSASNRQSGTASEKHQRTGIVADWSQRQLVFSSTNDKAVLARMQKDPRWQQSWYLHHREAWWPGTPRRPQKKSSNAIQRDWNVSLGNVSFGPIMDSGNVAPGGGQTFPAKYTFDVTTALAPSNCTTDYVAMGLPATASGSQANIVGYNNLYSEPGGTGFCSGTGPNMIFSYASGTGEVPASISLSLDGTKLAYVEDILTGESFFHVLTIGTTGSNGSGATAAVVPGSGNNATDLRVQLTPDSGTTNQSSTTAPFIDYQNDAAFVTTYSEATLGGVNGTGYLYKISPVFGAGTPAIVWSVAINCGSPSSVPSSPVYDPISNHIFFTDTGSRIDYVTDTTTPTLVCGSVGSFANTAANPPVVDVTNEVAYYTLNSNGTNEFVTEVAAGNPASGSVGGSVGAANTTYTSPYNVDFSNDYYNCVATSGSCAGNPLLYLAGTDAAAGTTPTLYTWNIVATDSLLLIAEQGAVTPTNEVTSTALATGAADSSPVTEFFNDPDGNPADGTDYLFVGVTDHCPATEGGSGGCVMSFNITNTSFNSGTDTWINPVTAGPSTTALAASGGPTGIVVDNDSTDPQASSIYYATKSSPATLVKATQSGLQ